MVAKKVYGGCLNTDFIHLRWVKVYGTRLNADGIHLRRVNVFSMGPSTPLSHRGPLALPFTTEVLYHLFWPLVDLKYTQNGQNANFSPFALNSSAPWWPKKSMEGVSPLISHTCGGQKSMERAYTLIAYTCGGQKSKERA